MSTTAERALVARVAAQTAADVVDFYEVGATHAHYTVRKQRAGKLPANLIADKLEPEARRRFLAALKALRGHFDEQAFGRAYAAGDVDAMLDTFAAAEIGGTLRPALDTIVQGFAHAAIASALQVGKQTGVGLQWGFDVTNPSAAQWGYVWSGELITQISEQTRDAVKLAVGRAMDADLSRRDATLMIRSIVGLNDKQANAVTRYRNDLLATGASGTAVETRSAAYADRLLTERAHLIARTEMMSAANAGQREAWDQAADNGLIERGETQRVWILTDDDRLCEDCEAYDGESVGFDEEFDDGDPPLHPGCRCTVGLTFGDK